MKKYRIFYLLRGKKFPLWGYNHYVQEKTSWQASSSPRPGTVVQWQSKYQWQSNCPTEWAANEDDEALFLALRRVASVALKRTSKTNKHKRRFFIVFVFIVMSQAIVFQLNFSCVALFNCRNFSGGMSCTIYSLLSNEQNAEVSDTTKA